MSTSNYGVSAFGVNSLVPTFNQIITNEVTAQPSEEVRLNSDVGIVFEGALANQELFINSSQVLSSSAPYFQTLIVQTIDVVVTLPPIGPGYRFMIHGLTQFYLQSQTIAMYGCFSYSDTNEALGIPPDTPFLIPIGGTLIISSADNQWLIWGLGSTPAP
jgi:hypothetical protein